METRRSEPLPSICPVVYFWNQSSGFPSLHDAGLGNRFFLVGRFCAIGTPNCLRQTTSFTCCARDHFVGSRARPLRAKDALRPPACGPALAGSGRRSGHILACGEDATSQNVKVKPALSEIVAQSLVVIQRPRRIAQLVNAAAHLRKSFLMPMALLPAHCRIRSVQASLKTCPYRQTQAIYKGPRTLGLVGTHRQTALARRTAVRILLLVT
jgi:hypothetical protein